MGYLLVSALIGLSLLLGWWLTRWQATVKGDLGRSLVFLGISTFAFVLLASLYILMAWPLVPWGS